MPGSISAEATKARSGTSLDTSKAPIRAEMSTTVNCPQGVIESAGLYAKPSVPAHLLEKRKKMKDALIQRFTQQHGADSVRTALITREVDACKALMAGTLTADGLKALEHSVAKAVSAAVPAPLPPHVGMPDVPRRGDPKTDFAVNLKKVADWTSVAHHRANYYLVEQQRKADAFNQRKDELHELLAHQIQQVEHDKRLRRHQQQVEAKEMQKKLDEFEAEKYAKVLVHKAKVQSEMSVRAEQMKELKARRAAADRLKKLEDEEMMNELERQKAADREKLRLKQLADEEYHRKTMEANAASKRAREEAQRRDWDDEMRLNRQWKEMLDKQEFEREEANRKRLERISKQSKDYADTTGAAIAARDAHEEAMRNMWVAKKEAENLAMEKARAQKRKDDNHMCTDYQLAQSRDHALARRREREEEVRRRHEIAAAAQKELDRTNTEKANMRARELRQQALLTEQMHEREANEHLDPGSATMTPLEANFNRSLLVSMAQHTYDGVHVLN